MKELCSSAGFDFYIDHDNDVNFFEIGSMKNTTDAIVHDKNLYNLGEFAEDLTFIRNKIKVYGAVRENTQILYTAEDTTTTPVREDIYRDDNITSYDQAKDTGDARLAELKDPIVTGEITAPIMATIQPGEQVQISVPYSNLDYAFYDILSYKTEINNESGKYETTLRVNKEQRSLLSVFKGMYTTQNSTKNTSNNPYGMEHSYDFLFTDDEGTHSTTMITDGVLKLVSGSSGNWTSPKRTLTVSPTHAYLILNASFITSVKVELSLDDGTSWQTLTNLTDTEITSTSGTDMVLRITISSSNVEIDSISVQYK